MAVLDTALDWTLAGYTRLGARLRAIDVAEEFPGVRGRHVLVTGATGGIGRATALRLADNGAIVHAVGRSSDKLTGLVEAAHGTILPHRADLSSMEQIVALAESLVASGDPLNGLVNNVGVMIHERTVTAEGWELTYATNVLGQYVLTSRLIPRLEASAPARIVMVSSGGMYSQALTASNLQSNEGEYNGTDAYARTKRAQVVLGEMWADELGDKGIRVNSMHPGWVDTAGVRDSLPTFRRLTRPLLRNEAAGADTIVWLVASDEASTETGKFFHDRVARPTHRLATTKESDSQRGRFLDQVAADAARYLDSSRSAPTQNGVD